MRFARWTFTFAGIYGLAVTAPPYFQEEAFGRQYPPPITHPEFYYGFLAIVVAWQVAFLIIGRDPVRHRPLMVPAILEKLIYPATIGVLYAQGRSPDIILGLALVDLAIGVLFVIAFLRLSRGPAGAV